MAGRLDKYIEYFRRCYRADSYDLSIWNTKKIRKDRKLYISEDDVLASGALPRLPIVGDTAASLMEQADTYRKERLLIYGCLMVTGVSSMASVFSSQRTLCSPLIYFPAKILQDDDLYLEIDGLDLRVNLPVLRQLLQPDLPASAVV